MLDIYTIKNLGLIREIRIPQTEEQKFDHDAQQMPVQPMTSERRISIANTAFCLTQMAMKNLSLP